MTYSEISNTQVVVQPISILMVVDNAGHRTEEFIRNEIRYLSERVELLHVLTGPLVGSDIGISRSNLLEHSSVPLGVLNICRALPRLSMQIIQNSALIRFAIRNVRDPRKTLITLFKYAPIIDRLQLPYDIVHVQFGHMLYDVNDLRKAGLIQARKLACSFRGHDISQVQLVTKLKRFFADREPIDLLLPVSDLFRRELIDMGAASTITITKYSPIDLKKIRKVNIGRISRPFDRPLKVLSCGRLIQTKGFEILIRAVSALKMTLDIELEIIGEGPLKGVLTELIADLGLSETVKLVGSLPHDEVLQKIADASVFILCSQMPPNGDREGIPNVLKEAMALRTLVVASSHSGIPELIKDGESGLLFDEGSVESLIQRVTSIAMMQDSDLMRIIYNAEMYVLENFDSDRLGAKQLAEYSRILDVE